MADHPLVLGTAGHIDHGKTSLVHALTGIDTDRLAVEKARGITTELGFAHLTIGERRIAVVDVPGHERFVKSMVAGATGLDVVCLVIAADEGVMPQTREHLEICHLLGVRRGLVALTKVDLVDDDWLALVTGDVRAALAGTFLERAEILGVSTHRPATLDALKAALGVLVADLPPREATGVFRLPIDRVFTIKGFGTVVTGTMLGGTVALGDELVAIPSGRTARVRGIEVHGGAVERATAGLRVAINLGGIAVDELARGDLLVHPGAVAPSHILDVELARPLPKGKVLVHHAASQVLASLIPVGDGNLAQLRLDARTPLGALPGDRFILRGFVPTATHGTTIGGGRIVRVLAPKARRRDDHATVVTALAAAPPDARLALEIKSAAFAGLALAELVRRSGLPADALAEPLATLVASGELLQVGDHYLHATAVASVEHKLLALLEGARETIRGGLPAAIPPRVFDAIVDGLAQRGRLVAIADRLTRAAPVAPRLAPIDAKLVELFRGWALEPLRPQELATALAVDAGAAKAALDRVVAAKLVVRVKPDLFVHAEAIVAIRRKLLAHLEAHATIDAGQWKALTGASRKFTIPLAEYFDAEKVTLRIGDLRRKR